MKETRKNPAPNHTVAAPQSPRTARLLRRGSLHSLTLISLTHIAPAEEPSLSLRFVLFGGRNVSNWKTLDDMPRQEDMVVARRPVALQMNTNEIRILMIDYYSI